MGNGASSSVQWRLNKIAPQIEAHENMCSKLRAVGQTCPDYFKGAYEKAHGMGLISNTNAASYKHINREANRAKHRF